MDDQKQKTMHQLVDAMKQFGLNVEVTPDENGAELKFQVPEEVLERGKEAEKVLKVPGLEEQLKFILGKMTQNLSLMVGLAETTPEIAEVIKDKKDYESLSREAKNKISKAFTLMEELEWQYREEHHLEHLSPIDFLNLKNPDTGKMVRNELTEQIILMFLQQQRLPKEKHIYANDPLSNALSWRFDSKGEVLDVVNQGLWGMKVLNSNKKGEVTIPVEVQMLLPEELQGVTLLSKDKKSAKLYTGYDKSINDSINTLAYYGKDVFSLEDVCKTMSADFSNHERITPKQKRDVIKFMEKAGFTKIVMDRTKELKARYGNKLPENAQAKISEPLLSIRTLEIKVNGEKRTYYQLLKKPPLLEIAEETKQLLTVDNEIRAIKTKKGGSLIPLTEERFPVRDYLLQRIAVMRHSIESGKNSQSQNILYKSIAEAAKIDPTDRQKKIRTIAFIKKCLDYWKQLGKKPLDISGYKEVRVGKSVRHFTIYFDAKSIAPQPKTPGKTA